MPPPPTGSRIGDARAAVADIRLWRQLLCYALLLPLAMVWIPAIVFAWSVPPVLLTLPVYYTAFAASQAQLGPFVIDTMTKASVVAAIGVLLLLVVSPVLMRAASALDGELAGRCSGGRRPVRSRSVSASS